MMQGFWNFVTLGGLAIVGGFLAFATYDETDGRVHSVMKAAACFFWPIIVLGAVLILGVGYLAFGDKKK